MMKKVLSSISITALMLMLLPTQTANAVHCTYQQIEEMIKNHISYQQIEEYCELGGYADDDKDGIKNKYDNCSSIANADQKDTDKDGTGDVCDSTPNGNDSDLDGISDANDNCQTVANPSQTDNDNDGIGNECDSTPNGPDADTDGVADSSDNCPAISNSNQLDTDKDGIGDACDSTPNGNQPKDTDKDGIADTSDNCPYTANANQTDTDKDGMGDVCDHTPYGDGGGGGQPVQTCPSGWYWSNTSSACLMINTTTLTCEDIVLFLGNPSYYHLADKTIENLNAFYQYQNCGQQQPQQPTDTDKDGIADTSDNCPYTKNASQTDTDKDGMGDVCDHTPNGNGGGGTTPTDTDKDGIADTSDNCPYTKNASQTDTDKDGMGDVCDHTPNGNGGGGTTPTDTDKDGKADTSDNCPAIANPDQKDTDKDGTGDACDSTPNGSGGGTTPPSGGGGADPGDKDGDSWPNAIDNCPDVGNPDQLDSDKDGIGNACETSPTTTPGATGSGGKGTAPLDKGMPNVVITQPKTGGKTSYIPPEEAFKKSVEDAKQMKLCQKSGGKLYIVNNQVVCACSKYSNAWDMETGCAYNPPAHSDLNFSCAPWGNTYITKLRAEGIMVGYGNDQFRPCQYVTRAEMLKLAMAASGHGAYQCNASSCPNFFPDLYGWQAPWVNQAYILEIVEGYPNGHIDKKIFHPNRMVTRAEATKMALASFGINPGKYKKTAFEDVIDWAKPWVEKARLLGIVKGVGGAYFQPDRPMTRAEAAKVIYLLKKYKEAMGDAA